MGGAYRGLPSFVAWRAQAFEIFAKGLLVLTRVLPECWCSNRVQSALHWPFFRLCQWFSTMFVFFLSWRRCLTALRWVRRKEEVKGKWHLRLHYHRCRLAVAQSWCGGNMLDAAEVARSNKFQKTVWNISRTIWLEFQIECRHIWVDSEGLRNSDLVVWWSYICPRPKV